MPVPPAQQAWPRKQAGPSAPSARAAAGTAGWSCPQAPELLQGPESGRAVSGTPAQTRARGKMLVQLQGCPGPDAGAAAQLGGRPQHEVPGSERPHAPGHRAGDRQRQVRRGGSGHDVTGVHEGQRRIDPVEPGVGSSKHMQMQVDLGRGALDDGSGPGRVQIPISSLSGRTPSRPCSSLCRISSASAGSGSSISALRHCRRASSLRPVRHKASP